MRKCGRMKYCKQYELSGSPIKPDRIVLMSRSPRRRELLAFLQPEVDSVDLDERAIEDHFEEVFREDNYLDRSCKICCELAKAKSGDREEENTLYISSDTIVLHRNQIYNKPNTLEEARTMLRSYLGEVHTVATAVCLRAKNYLDVFYTLANVHFVPESPFINRLLEDFLATGSSLDKSGAYAIQELHPALVDYIEGDIHTIIGLPVAAIMQRLC